MNQIKNTSQRAAFYLGVVLIAIGVLLRWLIEQTLVSDNRIESPLYGALIYAFQILAIAAGTFLLIRQPPIRLPRKE